MNAKMIFLSTAVGLGFTCSTHAGDATAYPGNACQAQDCAKVGELSRFPDLFENSAARYRTPTCPIVRDGNLDGVVGTDVGVLSLYGVPLECYWHGFRSLASF